MEEIAPIVTPVIPRIIIEVIGNQAQISIVGIEPLNVLMLLGQFTSIIAGQIKKGDTQRIVLPTGVKL